MVRIIKLGDLIYENIEPTVIEPIEFDANGEPIKFQEAPNPILPQEPVKLSQSMSETLVWLAKQRLQKVLDEYGYYSLGDIQFYVSQNDAEAQTILNWYQTYDTAIWDYIAQNFDPIINGTQQATVDQLLQSYSDLKAIEEDIFNQSLQASPLP